MQEIQNQKKAKLTAVIVAAIASIVLGIVAIAISYSISAIEEKALKILFSIGVGITTQCLTVAIALIIIALKFKYPLGYVIATVFGLIALLILFILVKMDAWVIVILMAGLSLIAFLSFFLVYRSKLVLVANNEKSDYKDYKTRQAEKETEKECEEELPKIKSFKD